MNGTVIDFNIETGIGRIEAIVRSGNCIHNCSSRIFDFTRSDIQSMTVGPSSFENIKIGQQVNFTADGNKATNVNRA